MDRESDDLAAIARLANDVRDAEYSAPGAYGEFGDAGSPGLTEAGDVDRIVIVGARILLDHALGEHRRRAVRGSIVERIGELHPRDYGYVEIKAKPLSWAFLNPGPAVFRQGIRSLEDAVSTRLGGTAVRHLDLGGSSGLRLDHKVSELVLRLAAAIHV